MDNKGQKKKKKQGNKYKKKTDTRNRKPEQV